MSYSTRIDIQFSHDAPAFDDVIDCVRAQFDRERFGVDDILAELQRGWEEGKAEFNRLECSDVEGLMRRISAKFPKNRMCVRGIGEEWRDLWLREFEAGKIVYSAGPFLEGKSPSYFRFFFGSK